MALEEQMPVGTGTPKHLVWKALGLCLGLANRRSLGHICTYMCKLPLISHEVSEMTLGLGEDPE